MSRSQRDSLEDDAARRLAAIDRAGLRRQLKPTQRLPGGKAVRGGQRLVSFCDNDYLGLSSDPRLIQAAQAAAAEYGAGAGAARLVTGDCPLNERLESQLADIKGQAAARVFGSGYLANLGTIPVLVGPGDLIVMDQLRHACMDAGARLSGAEIRIFRHNDAEHAEALLADRPRGARALVLTETVFSMDGDLAPLDDLSAVCDQHEAWLMTDDAHGFGVIDRPNPAAIQMGTLSKAVGVYGGYVAGPAAMIELLANRARSFVYATGLPPPVLGATLAALDVMQAEPERRARVMEHARMFASMIGAPVAESAIIPIIAGSAARAMALSDQLAKDGFLVAAIRPPTVPEGTSRLRVAFSAAHEDSDVRRFAELTPRLLAAESSAT